MHKTDGYRCHGGCPGQRAKIPEIFASESRKCPEKLWHVCLYSKIPILRPPLGLSKSGLKTTFGQSQRWSLIRDTLGEENEETNILNLANKVFNWQNVLIICGRNSGISLYFPVWYWLWKFKQCKFDAFTRGQKEDLVTIKCSVNINMVKNWYKSSQTSLYQHSI